MFDKFPSLFTVRYQKHYFTLKRWQKLNWLCNSILFPGFETSHRDGGDAFTNAARNSRPSSKVEPRESDVGCCPSTSLERYHGVIGVPRVSEPLCARPKGGREDGICGVSLRYAEILLVFILKIDIEKIDIRGKDFYDFDAIRLNFVGKTKQSGVRKFQFRFLQLGFSSSYFIFLPSK